MKQMWDKKELEKLIQEQGGGGGEPAAYLKSASVSGNQLTLTNKDNTTVQYTPDLTDYVTTTDLSTALADYTPTADLATVATTGAYSDLTGTPTIPDAVSGTNDGTNWTSLTIGSDTYGLAGGGGSVDIDNKTIVENLDGELETAIGGYTEVIHHEASQGVDSGALTAGSGDFDLYDTDIASAMYNVLTGADASDFCIISAEYNSTPITIKLVGLKDAEYDSDKWNTGNTAFYDENSEYRIQFFINKADNGRIHIWQSGGPETLDTISNINVGGHAAYDETIVHQIDSKYIPDTSVMNIDSLFGRQLTDAQYQQALEAKILLYNNEYYIVESNTTTEKKWIKAYVERLVDTSGSGFTQDELFLYKPDKIIWNTQNNEYLNISNSQFNFNTDSGVISTVIGGGRGNQINISASDFTLNGDHYECTNPEFDKLMASELAGFDGFGWDSTSNFTEFYDSSDPDNVAYNPNVQWSKSEVGTTTVITVTSSELSGSEITRYTYGDRSIISFTMKYSSGFVGELTSNSIDFLKISESFAQRFSSLVEKVNPKYVYPDAPTTAGTYVLKATVDSGGNVTYSWVSA